NPQLSHEKALKRIGRNLKATWKKVLILKPCQCLKVGAYQDADFAGLYGYAKIMESECFKGGTGFLITVSKYPVWVSKLQSETVNSTMEAEVIALAHCCCECFIVKVAMEVGNVMGLETQDLVLMHVSIHEDDANTLMLAETILPEFTPHSKYCAIKIVWFCVEIKKCGIKLLKINAVEQLGDNFTKGLPRATFEYLQEKMMDW
ncbi:hypothetical protein ACHAW6_008824, partial [Cyclotella cf. meneghiniana]